MASDFSSGQPKGLPGAPKGHPLDQWIMDKLEVVQRKIGAHEALRAPGKVVKGCKQMWARNILPVRPPRVDADVKSAKSGFDEIRSNQSQVQALSAQQAFQSRAAPHLPCHIDCTSLLNLKLAIHRALGGHKKWVFRIRKIKQEVDNESQGSCKTAKISGRAV